MTDGETSERLVGRAFRGASLEGSDFVGADVRGADFTGADLRGADFTDARVGVAPRTGVLLLGVAILVSIGAGVAIGWMVDDVRRQVRAEEWDEAAGGGSAVLLLLAFVVVIFWRGFDLAIKVLAVLYVGAIVVNVIANLVWDDVEWFRVVRFTVLIVMLFLAILAGILGRVIGGVFGGWSIALVAVVGGLATGRAEGGVAGAVVAVNLALISKRAVRGDRRDRTIRRLAHRLVGRHGTLFTDADLTGAKLNGVDSSMCTFTGATLTDVIWDAELPLPLEMPDDERPPGR